jgi:thiol-disulfide isomerase/thioredoxin
MKYLSRYNIVKSYMKFLKTIQVLFLIAWCISCNDVAQKGNEGTSIPDSVFVLDGMIANCVNCKVYIEYSGRGSDVTDSVHIINESFSLTGELNEPQVVTVKVKNETNTYEEKIFLTNGERTAIKLDANNKIIADGKSHREYMALKEIIKTSDEKINKLDSLYNKALDEENVSVTDSLYEVLQLLQSERHKLVADFVQQKPSSSVNVYALITNFSFDFDAKLLETALYSLNEKAKASHDWKYLDTEVLQPAKATNIGNLAPEFSITDSSGGELRIRDMKGKVVLLDFWASWCAPCRALTKQLKPLYDKYKNEGLEIVSISLDRNESAWKKASARDRITWKNFCDLKGFSNIAVRTYGVKALPANFLIDRNGKIIARHIRGKSLEIEISKLFS